MPRDVDTATLVGHVLAVIVVGGFIGLGYVAVLGFVNLAEPVVTGFLGTLIGMFGKHAETVLAKYFAQFRRELSSKPPANRD